MAQPRPSPQQQQLVPPPHQVIATQAHGPARLAQFHAPATSDVDAAMARAMLAVISSSDQPRRPCGAFEPYHGASTAAQPKTGAAAQLVRQGQGMIKRAFSVLRETRAPPPPEGTGRQLSSSNNQTNHVMSERKRREKLNESFDALRGTLPPGTKKDKASVLASAMDVVKSLRAEISELEGKNRSMEARLLQLHQPAVDGSSEDDDPAGEMVGVLIKIDKAGPARRTCSSSGSTFPRQVQLRVAAPVEFCGVVGLVLHILECLKKVIMVRGAVELVSLEAGVHVGRQMNPIAGGRAIVTMQIEVCGGGRLGRGLLQTVHRQSGAGGDVLLASARNGGCAAVNMVIFSPVSAPGDHI